MVRVYASFCVFTRVCVCVCLCMHVCCMPRFVCVCVFDIRVTVCGGFDVCVCAHTFMCALRRRYVCVCACATRRFKLDDNTLTHMLCCVCRVCASAYSTTRYITDTPPCRMQHRLMYVSLCLNLYLCLRICVRVCAVCAVCASPPMCRGSMHELIFGPVTCVSCVSIRVCVDGVRMHMSKPDPNMPSTICATTCVCVRITVCMCVCVRACGVCVSLCVCVRVCDDVGMCARVSRCVCVCVFVSTRARTSPNSTLITKRR